MTLKILGDQPPPPAPLPCRWFDERFLPREWSHAADDRFVTSWQQMSTVVTAPYTREVPTGGVLQRLRHWACLPSLIIIGAAKSGTTMLEELIWSHRCIVGSKRFNTTPIPPWPGRAPPWSQGRHIQDAGQIRFFSENHSTWAAGVPWYAANFPPAAEASYSFVTEKTAFYFSDMVAALRMHAVLPRVRLLAIVREPVARMWSQIQMQFDQSFTSEKSKVDRWARMATPEAEAKHWM